MENVTYEKWKVVLMEAAVINGQLMSDTDLLANVNRGNEYVQRFSFYGVTTNGFSINWKVTVIWMV